VACDKTYDVLLIFIRRIFRHQRFVRARAHQAPVAPHRPPRDNQRKRCCISGGKIRKQTYLLRRADEHGQTYRGEKWRHASARIFGALCRSRLAKSAEQKTSPGSETRINLCLRVFSLLSSNCAASAVMPGMPLDEPMRRRADDVVRSFCAFVARIFAGTLAVLPRGICRAKNARVSALRILSTSWRANADAMSNCYRRTTGVSVINIAAASAAAY
jgi:hypothetical protein